MIFLLLILFITPFLLTQLVKKLKVEHIFSPIVTCFIIGIILGNTGLLKVDNKLFQPLASATVLLAIPLLLITTDFKKWMQHIRPFLKGISTAMAGVFLASAVVYFIWGQHSPHAPIVLAMTTASLIGTSTNLSAVGIALNADDATFALVTSIDVLCGGVLLLYLLGIAPRLYRYLLKPYQYSGNNIHLQTNDAMALHPQQKFKDAIFSLLAAMAIAAASAGISYLCTGTLKEEIILCSLSVLAVIAGMYLPPVQKLKTAEPIGQYLLLIFCFAVGTRADFSQLLHHSQEILLIMGPYYLLAALFQLVLYKIFNVDADTGVMTSAGTIFGPAFIGQIEAALGNKEVLLTGMVTAVLGYVTGNLAGFLVYAFYHYLSSN